MDKNVATLANSELQLKKLCSAVSRNWEEDFFSDKYQFFIWCNMSLEQQEISGFEVKLSNFCQYFYCRAISWCVCHCQPLPQQPNIS